jgi:hypothetical protein
MIKVARKNNNYKYFDREGESTHELKGTCLERLRECRVLTARRIA